MTNFNFKPAEEPTIYFIGVTTAKSSIMSVFPKWARHLGLKDAVIRGIDCKLHDDPTIYRRIVEFIKHDPLSYGALVTTHKLDLLRAARHYFDELDSFALLTDEISSISKREGRLIGHAKDPITVGLSLDAIIEPDYWRKTGAELLILGAGGSSVALTTHLMKSCGPDRWPSKIHVSNKTIERLNEMKAKHQAINPGITIAYYHATTPADNDAILNALKPGSIVINATGLGKDAPGSPLTDQAVFPQDGIAWDFNYRGELVFLDQARTQQQQRNLRIEDGWVYFIHGWTRVVAEVFDVEIPVAGPEFEIMSELAGSARGGIRKNTMKQQQGVLA
jgi:shikimate 5-dehydrogenase